MNIILYNVNIKTGNVRYYFNSLTRLKTKLNNNVVKTLTLDNYRLNTNTLNIKLLNESGLNGLTLSEAESVKTILLEDGDFFRFYTVDNFIIQSGYISFNLSVDNWHSYINKVTMQNRIVKRCNKILSGTILDQIELTRDEQEIEYMNVSGAINIGTQEQPDYAQFNTNRLYLVVALNFAVHTSLTGGTISRVALYAIKLRDFKTMLYNATTGATEKTSIARRFYYFLINSYLSGIYEVSYDDTTYLEGNVIGAWVINDALLDVTGSTIYTKSKMNLDGLSEVKLVLNNVRPSNKSFTSYIEIKNKRNKYYVGTKGSLLNIERFLFASPAVEIQAYVSDTSVKVIARNGDNEKDITQGFKCNYTTTNGNLTTQKEQLEIFKSILSYAGAGAGIVAGIATGNPLAIFGGIMGTAKTTTGILENVSQQHTGNVIESGDASISYKYNASYSGTTDQEALDYPVANPFVIVQYTSLFNEIGKGTITGAQCFAVNPYIENIIDAVEEDDYVGEPTDFTYIVMTANYFGAPQDALIEIENTFANGVNLLSGL